MIVRALACIALTLALQGCDALAPGSLGVVLRMDSSTYHRPADPHAMAAMGFTVANLGRRTAYLEGCIDPLSVAVERDSAGVWRGYLGTACQDDALDARLSLRFGETYHATFRWDAPNRYRLRLYYGDTPASPYARSAYGPPFELR